MKQILIKTLYPLSLIFLVIAAKILTEQLGFRLENDFYNAQLIFRVLIIISFSWLTINLVSAMKQILLKHHDISTEDNLKARKIITQFSLVQRVINFLIILIALSLILMEFDGIRKLGISLLASAGIAGIILGFAAQKLLTTIIAGLQIAFTQPIKIDDVVIVENEWGWIEEITLTFVVVRIWDKRRLVVPTTYFIERPFQNWTRTSADILGTIFIYTDYTLPIDELREELFKIVKKDEHWDGNTCVLQVTNATEKTMELRALVSAKNSPAAWELRVNTREQLIKFLQEKHPDSLPKTRLEIKND